MSDPSKTFGRLGDLAAGIALQARIAVLDGFHVEFRCECGRSTILTVSHLARKYGPHRRLTEIVDRAVCDRCRRPFRRAWLSETHIREFDSALQPGWSVQLRPFPGGIEAQSGLQAPE